MLIGGAGLPQDVVFDEMTEMIDLVPTMLQLGQANLTYQQYGKSLVDGMQALGQGKMPSHRNYSYTEGGFLKTDQPLIGQSPWPYDIKTALQHEHIALAGKALSVRSKNWTYVYRLYESDELYSRRSDPHELHNLAANSHYTDVRGEFRAVALDWLVGTPNIVPWFNDDRRPDPVQVPLKLPKAQYRERLEDCDGCSSYKDVASWPVETAKISRHYQA